MGQAGTHTFPKNLVFELGENGQQSGHRSPAPASRKLPLSAPMSTPATCANGRFPV